MNIHFHWKLKSHKWQLLQHVRPEKLYRNARELPFVFLLYLEYLGKARELFRQTEKKATLNVTLSKSLIQVAFALCSLTETAPFWPIKFPIKAISSQTHCLPFSSSISPYGFPLDVLSLQRAQTTVGLQLKVFRRPNPLFKW